MTESDAIYNALEASREVLTTLERLIEAGRASDEDLLSLRDALCRVYAPLVRVPSVDPLTNDAISDAIAADERDVIIDAIHAVLSSNVELWASDRAYPQPYGIEETTLNLTVVYEDLMTLVATADLADHVDTVWYGHYLAETCGRTILNVIACLHRLTELDRDADDPIPRGY